LESLPLGGYVGKCSAKQGVSGYYIYKNRKNVYYCRESETGKNNCSYCPCVTPEDYEVRCWLCAEVWKCVAYRDEGAPFGWACKEELKGFYGKGKCKSFNDPVEWYQYCELATPTPIASPTPYPTPTANPKEP
jgi:hypothetical protein